MKFVIQRVIAASVIINNQTTASINHGLLVYMAIHRDDQIKDCDKWVEKLLKLRIFADEHKPINRSIQDVNGEILLVSQFTLYGDTKGQNRPSFIQSKKPDEALPIYNYFAESLKNRWSKTQLGEFAKDMEIHSINDGPVTIIME